MKKFFGRKSQDTGEAAEDPEGTGSPTNEEDAVGRPVGGDDESSSSIGTKKSARFSEETVEAKPKKGGLRFAEPPPPSQAGPSSSSSSLGKKKEKKRVVMLMDDEEGKKKAKHTTDKPKRDKKEPVPPVRICRSRECLSKRTAAQSGVRQSFHEYLGGWVTNRLSESMQNTSGLANRGGSYAHSSAKLGRDLPEGPEL